MKRLILTVTLFFSFLGLIFSQKVMYSEVSRNDSKNINFEIIGKINGNFLVYKNLKSDHNIAVYDNEMSVVKKIKLDFIPDKTFNVDFIPYSSFFYMVYQYQKKGILYCMGVKLDGTGAKLGEPIIMDTTSIGAFADNKIYSTLFSEDKQKIMVFKIRKKNELFNIATILFDKDFNLIKKTILVSSFEDRADVYGDFLVDNEGNFLFTKGTKSKGREDINNLQLVIKKPLADTFNYYTLNLEEKNIDEVHVKIDNLHKKYIITSLYYKQKRGDIEGLYVSVFDNAIAAVSNSSFIGFADSLRAEAKGDEQMRRAFNDYFIRQIIVKKDGGFLLIAENYSSQNRGGSPFSRYDYFNRYPYFSSLDYYSYSPWGMPFYRPWNSFGSRQNVRYFYNNILALSLDKNSALSWASVIQKEQYDDDNDNYLSFFTMNVGAEIHFLFNSDNKNQVIANQSINTSGKITRNATLKSMEKGYQFMPKFAKQVGAKQIIIPCTYRGSICFAKVDFD